MKVRLLSPRGAKLFAGAVQSDLRGGFFKLFSADLFKENGLDFNPMEIFYSISKKDVIRGMHFQLPPYDQAKLVHVIKGRVDDVILDLRTDSSSYGEFISIELIAGDGKILYIPRGFAHGFLSRESESVVIYAVDAPYSPLKESGILYNSFGYDWGVEFPVLSERDASFVNFDKFNSPFKIHE